MKNSFLFLNAFASGVCLLAAVAAYQAHSGNFMLMGMLAIGNAAMFVINVL